MLSDLGKNLFFPKGILTQSAEAKEKAHKYNATIGIATEKGGPMYPAVHPATSSPPSIRRISTPMRRRPASRNCARCGVEKMLRENPSMQGKQFSNPIVTNRR